MIKMIKRLKQFKKTTLFRYTLILFVGIMSGELIFRACAHMPIFSYPTIRIVLSSLFISSFFAYLLSFTNKIFARIMIGLIIFLTNFYGYIQLGFNNFLGVYMSFGTSSQLGAVVDYIKDFLHSIKLIYYTNFIPFFLVVLYLIFVEKKLYNPDRFNITKEHKKYKFYLKTLNLVGTSLVLVSLYYLTITLDFMQNKLQLTSNKDLIVNPSVPSTAINEFGTTMFAFGDIRVTLFPMDEQLTFERTNKKQNKEVAKEYARVIDDAS